MGRDIGIAIGAGLFFLWLALTVCGGQPAAFDAALRDGVHGWASPGMTAAMKLVTRFGSAWYLLPVAGVVALLLAKLKSVREAALFAVAVGGAYILENGIKVLFHRVRPDPFFDYPRPSTYSFPSGHAFLAFSFYITLAVLLMDPQWPLARKAAGWAAAIAMTLWIGLSRIYLGVHYPTDVLGGYAAALAWIAVVRAALKRRGDLRRDALPGTPMQ